MQPMRLFDRHTRGDVRRLWEANRFGDRALTAGAGFDWSSPVPSVGSTQDRDNGCSLVVLPLLTRAWPRLSLPHFAIILTFFSLLVVPEPNLKAVSWFASLLTPEREGGRKRRGREKEGRFLAKSSWIGLHKWQWKYNLMELTWNEHHRLIFIRRCVNWSRKKTLVLS